MTNEWEAAGYRPVGAAAKPKARGPARPAVRQLEAQRVEQDLAFEPLRRASTATSIAQGQADLAKAPIDRKRALTQLEIEQETKEAAKKKAIAEAQKAEIEAEEAERRRPQPGKVTPMEGSSENRVRLALGFGPGVEAQKRMYDLEGWARGRGRNPFQSSPGAIIGKVFENVPLSGFLMPETVQDYQQAVKSFESTVVPVFAGANQSPSEVARQVKARFPAPDDKPSVLRTKSIDRAMMLNAAADLLGEPRPFPQLGALRITPDGKETRTPPQKQAKTGAAAGAGAPQLPPGFSIVRTRKPR